MLNSTFKQRKVFCLSLLFATLISSCSNHFDKGEVRKLTVDISNPKTVDFFELFEITKIQPLSYMSQTQGFDRVLSSIKINEEFSLLYTGDPFSVAVLDSSGVVMNQIVEDQFVSEVSAFNYFNNEIFIYDRNAQLISIYDLQLNFIESFVCPFYVKSFDVLSANQVLLYVGNEVTSNNSTIISYDLLNQKIVDQFHSIKKEHRSFLHLKTNNHFINSEIQMFWELGKNKIYQKIEGQYQLNYTIDFKGGLDIESYLDTLNALNSSQFLGRLRSDRVNSFIYNVIYHPKYLVVNHFLEENRGLTFTPLESELPAESVNSITASTKPLPDYVLDQSIYAYEG
jgi:hypothetical protein